MGQKISGFGHSRAFNLELRHINTGFSKQALIQALVIKMKAKAFSGSMDSNSGLAYGLGPKSFPALPISIWSFSTFSDVHSTIRTQRHPSGKPVRFGRQFRRGVGVRVQRVRNRSGNFFWSAPFPFCGGFHFDWKIDDTCLHFDTEIKSFFYKTLEL